MTVMEKRRARLRVPAVGAAAALQVLCPRGHRRQLRLVRLVRLARLAHLAHRHLEVAALVLALPLPALLRALPLQRRQIKSTLPQMRIGN